jgi:hypothetical protein
MSAPSIASIPETAHHVDAQRASGHRWYVRSVWPALILALLVLLQGARALPRLDDTLLHEDSGNYLLLARSLTAGGYQQLSAPGNPAHVLFPPMFPLALAGLRLAGAPSAVAAKTLVLLFGILVIPATYLLLRPRAGTGMALLITAWIAIHPDYLRSATTLCADAPYLAVSLLALLGILASARHPGWRDAAGIAAWMATMAAALMRAVGLPLMAIAPFYLAWHKARPQWSARVVALGLLSIAYVTPPLAWEVWKTTHASEQIGGYAKLLQLRNEYDWDAGTVTSASDLAQRYVRNTRRHIRGLGGLMIETGSDQQRSVIGLLMLGLIMGGLALQIRRGHYLLEAYLILAAIATVSHPAPQLPRYLIPFLPFLLFYPATLLSAAGPRGHRLAISALAVCLIAAVTTHDVEGSERALRPGYEAYRATAQWLGANTPPDAVVLCRKPALMYWWSGRKSVAFPLSRKPELMDERVTRYHITYVVEDSFSDRTPLFLAPWLASRESTRTLVHTDDETRIWQLHDDRDA